MYYQILICLLMALTVPAINIQNVYEWKEFQFRFPAQCDIYEAVVNGQLVPANAVPFDVAPHYHVEKGLRMFITIPRLKTGIPYTLAIVSENNQSTAVLEPYPNYSWHNGHGHDCDKITSAFCVTVTECNHLFVLDSGKIGKEQVCPPQLLTFDLNTDSLLLRSRFEMGIQMGAASLLMALAVLVHDPPPVGTCQSYHVYIADAKYHGLIIYDSELDAVYRVENKFMYPDPNFGTYTIAGDHFTSMDGISALATNQQFLFFHPMASVSEYAVPLSVLNNYSIWRDNSEAMQDEFRLVGKRRSQCRAEVMDSHNNLYCVTFDPIMLNIWNMISPYNATQRREIQVDWQKLEFVSSMKIFNHRDNGEELWMLSNQFQKVAAGTLTEGQIKFRVLRYKI